MRIHFIADSHVGNHAYMGGERRGGVNARAVSGLHALEAVTLLGRVGETIVHLGDVFDSSTPSPALIFGVQNVLRGPPNWVVLTGNHDRSSPQEGDAAVSPLGAVLGVQVVEAPTVVVLPKAVLIAIPYQTGDARVWLPRVLGGLTLPPYPHRILCLHLGVVDDDCPPYLRGAPDAIPLQQLLDLCQEFNITHVFSGNWHRHRFHYSGGSGVTVCQVGALEPTGWDNPGLTGYGRVVSLDTVSGEVTAREVGGNRFVVVEYPGTPPEAHPSQHLHVRIRHAHSVRKGARCWGQGHVDRGNWASFRLEEVDPQKEERRQEAVQAVQRLEGQQEVLGAYIGSLDLTPEERREVQSRTVEILYGG